MNPVLVWDLPTRLFHMLLALICIASFTLAFGPPEHSWVFDCHMLIGLIPIPMVLFRLLWGFTGTTYAKFRSLIYSPREAFNYLASMVRGKSMRHIGHNPAASYAILAMLALVPGCVVSGLLIPSSKIFQELHEILAFILMGIIGTHLTGVLIHTIVHKENVVVSMLTGTKMAHKGEGIRSAHYLVALFIILITGTWTVVVVKSYDFKSRKLEVPLIGTVMQFGKSVQDDSTHREDEND